MTTAPEKPRARREWGEGSVYQRASDWRWIGAVDVPGEGRRRITVSAKGCTGGCPKRCSHRNALLKKLRKKQDEIDASGTPTQRANTTVAQWATAWLEIKKGTLSPNGYNAAASPVRKWIIPTIGHKRLDTLTPADVRTVAAAQHAAGLRGATAAATHRTLLNLLRAGIVEGHQIPPRVLLVAAPTADESDRMDLPVDQSVACLRVAADLPHGVRWAMALLYGPRQGEVLGLVETDPINGEPCVDFDAHEIRLAWQLDNLPSEHGCAGGDAAPTCGRQRAGWCTERRFRTPKGYVAVHLVDSYHLVRPKSKKGIRVLPMTAVFEKALKDWLDPENGGRPANPWGLVFPAADGTPANSKDDLAEWHAIQGAASLTSYDDHTDLGPVLVGHPTRAQAQLASGRTEPHGYFHIHECRNVTATQLGEAGVDPAVIQSLLGHATAAQSDDYRRIHRAPKLAAIEAVAEVLPFSPRRADA